jgi:hypothetical protein
MQYAAGLYAVVLLLTKKSTWGMKVLAHSCDLVPNWYGRISTRVEPSVINNALLLPEPWSVTSTLAERTDAIFLHAWYSRRRHACSASARRFVP